MRIHFTMEDLARLRMVLSLGPVAESIFALDLLGRHNNPAFHGWRKAVRGRLDGRDGEARRLSRERGVSAELLWMLECETGDATRSQARQRASLGVYEFCQIAVLPYWRPVSGYLNSVRDTYGRIGIANGVEGMLGALHPKLHWAPLVLEIPGESDRDVYLNGRGLLLSPSLFLHGKTCVMVESERESGLPALAFSVPFDSAIATRLWDTDDTDEHALGALVGHTRAAALEALADSCTTGELSQRLNISLAGASKHATVLRKAGLITTARNRNTALHTLTALGSALLRNRPRTTESAPDRELIRIGE